MINYGCNLVEQLEEIFLFNSRSKYLNVYNSFWNWYQISALKDLPCIFLAYSFITESLALFICGVAFPLCKTLQGSQAQSGSAPLSLVTASARLWIALSLLLGADTSSTAFYQD